MKNPITLSNSYRILTVLIISLLFTFSSIAQKINYSDSWGKQGYSVISEKTSAVKVNYSINNFSISDQNINGEAMQVVTLPDQFLPNDEGAPNLPGSGRYIAIPQGTDAKLTIVSSRVEKFKNVNLAPAPRIPLDTEKEPLEYKKDQKIYSVDAFYPADPIKLSGQTQIRGVDVIMLGITPFQYNPVTKELVVYRDIEVEITFEGGNSHFGEDRLRSRYWDPILKDALLNSASLPKMNYNHSSGNSREDGFEYVIVIPDDDDFLFWADSLRMWRIKQGISTTILTTTDMGGNTPTAIENYIDYIYENWDPAPDAILLMGDYGTSGNTIISPIWDGYCASDNIYADVNNNKMPDVILARMCAQDESQLETMVTKIINYENNPPTSPDFYDHPITALGWQTERWFQICSESVGGFFKHVQGKDPVRINEVYGGNPMVDPWSTATNTSTVVSYFGPDGLGYIPATPAELGGWSGGNANDVNYAINNGAFLLQHRDHGGTTGWGEPDYSNSNINGLTNTDLTFVFSINCLTGKYNISGECFAEKFHRYTYNGNNSGALGIIAASEISYSFVNDTYVWGMYDNMWPDFMPDYGTPPEPRGLLPAFGNAGGKYFLQQSNWPYNTSNKEVTYYLFHHHGGAFSTLYSEVPQDLTVLHDDVLLAGLNSFSVTADEGSFIALTVGDEIIGTAEGTGAPVNISIEPQYPPSMVDITVFKTNYLRYSASVQVIPPDGPYIIQDSFTFSDSNENGQMDYDETIVLTVTMKNVGSEDAENVEVTLSTTDEYVTLTDNNETYGTIAVGESVTIDNGFSFDVAADIPDEHLVVLEVTADDGSKEIWNSSIAIKGHAPVLEFIDFVIDDASGNGNGKVDPGETADIIITVGNNGSSDAYEVYGELLTSDSYININSGELLFGDISPDGNLFQSFSVTANAATTIGHLAEFYINFLANAGISAVGEFEIVIGQVPILILDLDNNQSSGPQMNTLITNLDFMCDYSITMPGDAQLYSTIFVCLGIYSNNYKLTTAQGTELAEFLDNGGNLYMEGGDTWYYDNQTDVHPYFNIDATNDGNGDLGTIQGQDGTFTEGMNYSYAGENSWIDHIIPESSSAMQIFMNQSPSYGNAVAYDEGTYKTIGTSFEFGGLVDGASTKLELMAKYLEFFGFTEPPEAPPQPTGLTEVCGNAQAVEYQTLSVPNADAYAWIVSPVEAGFAYGNDTIGFVNWNPEFGGIATVKVCGVNMSGMGTFSEGLEVTVTESPTATISGNFEICEYNSIEIPVEITGNGPWEISFSCSEDTISFNELPFTYLAFPDSEELTVDYINDVNGCINTGTGSVSFTFIDGPDVDLGADTSICCNHTIELSAPEGFVSYLWSDGSTETSMVVDSSGVSFGPKEVWVEVSNEECTTTAYLTITFIECPGINELDNVEIEVYPNPNNGIFKFVINTSENIKLKYRIFNSSGNLVLEKNDFSIDRTYNETINLSIFAEGIYYLFIETEKGMINRKIIVR